MLFVCPKCLGKLNIKESGAAVCEKGHSYDRAKQGYYNLLLSDSGGTHGDNREMVLARREFLSRGFYEPLANKIASVCTELISDGGAVLDAGCGEGYYTEHLKNALRESGKHGVRISVFDISKDAVKAVAKRACADEYAVAGSYHMPLRAGSVDLILNTFSPQAKEETARVLRSGGYFVMAIPAAEHLYGLKAAIYKTPYKNTVEDTSLDGFTLLSSEEVRYTMQLKDGRDIKALFMMTPYAYRTSAPGRNKILSMSELETDAHFFVLTYKKN